MSSLLDEAIVDAKALREAVLKSAEASLLETYAPKIQEAVEQMLEQEDPLADPMAMEPMASPPQDEEGEETEAMFDPKEDEVMPDELGEAAFDPDEEEIRFEISAGELKEMMESALREVGEEDGGEDNEYEFTAAIDKTLEDMGKGLPDPLAESESEFEINEELIQIFEQEAPSGTTEDYRTWSTRDRAVPICRDMHGLDVKETKDRTGRDVWTCDPSKPIDTGDTGDTGSPEELPKDLQIKVYKEGQLDELNIEEIVESLVVDLMPTKSGWAGTPESVMQHNEELAAAMAESDEYKEQKKELLKVGRELAESNKKFQTVNSKLMETVETLKQKLDEVNLANAKLLYTNRILRKSSLNERQKETIVEALSNAGSVNEAKVIFETLQSAVGTSQKRSPQSLSEAVSRPSTMLPRKKAQNTDINPFAERMRILAGIKNK